MIGKKPVEVKPDAGVILPREHESAAFQPLFVVQKA